MTSASERRMNVVIAAAVLASITLGALAFLAGMSAGAGVRDSVDCDEWTFERGAWRDHPASTAQALVDCETLIGFRRREVTGLLGGHSGRPDRWTFDAGAANDYMGPGDANYLFVNFGADERVERAHLLYEGERAVVD